VPTVGSNKSLNRRHCGGRSNSICGDFFEFDPIFKLFIVGNHKPIINNVDEAFRRRIHLIPFSVTIPPEDRDPDLFEKLREEWPGILKLVIEGSMDWHRQGLNPPAVVRNAATVYFAEQDVVGRWIEDRCIMDKTAHALSADLYRDYKAWCEENGEPVGSQRSLGESLLQKGCVKWRDGSGARGYQGIALRSK